MSAVINPSQAQFAQLVAEQTHLDPKVIEAWLLAEEPASRDAAAQGYNWLNIGPGRTYANVQQAAAATSQLLNTSGYYSGIRAAAAKRNPLQELQAIASSPWDAGHYAQSPSKPAGNLLSIFQQVGGKPGGSGGGFLSSIAGATPSAGSVASAIGATALGPIGQLAGAIPSGALGGITGSVIGDVETAGLWLLFVGLGIALVFLGITRLAPDSAKQAAGAAGKAGMIGALAA